MGATSDSSSIVGDLEDRHPTSSRGYSTRVKRATTGNPTSSIFDRLHEKRSQWTPNRPISTTSSVYSDGSTFSGKINPWNGSERSSFSAATSISLISSIMTDPSFKPATSIPNGQSFKYTPPWNNRPLYPEQSIKKSAADFSYYLPCEFTFLGCQLRFRPEEFEAWISHSISHFTGIPPPVKATCTFCKSDDRIFESYKNPYDNWRERMFHVGNHLQKGELAKSVRPDYVVIEYMRTNNILSQNISNRAFEVGKESHNEAMAPINQQTSEFQDKTSPAISNTISQCGKAREEESHMPKGGCQYLFLEPTPGEDRCECGGFQMNHLRPGRFCNCGHRCWFHATETGQDALQETEQKEETHRTLYENGEGTGDACIDVKGTTWPPPSSLDPERDQTKPRGRSRTPVDFESTGYCGNDNKLYINRPNYESREAAERPNSPYLDGDSSGSTVMAEDDEVAGSPSSFSPERNSEMHSETQAGNEVSEERLGSMLKASSFTNSTCSEDQTDWEEESDIDSAYLDEILERARRKEHTLIGVQLPLVKAELVDRLMTEFWVLFDQNWESKSRQHGTNPASTAPSISSSSSGLFLQSSLLSHGKKRSRNNDYDESPDESDRNGPKRCGITTEFLDTEEARRFACPYRKHNPRTYCVQDWSSCALTPHKTVARVKAHLYRYHLIHQCQRCKENFDSEIELDTHIEAMDGCQSRPAEPVDGITRKMKEQIQCRKKTSSGQTEAERWQQIYRLLFPHDPVPSPYFEPIRDHIEASADPLDYYDLINFEDYLRRELPRLFRNALEAAVNAESQPIEEDLRSQLIDIMEETQNQAFSSYRALRRRTAGAEPISSPEQDMNSTDISGLSSSHSGTFSQISTQQMNAERPSNYSDTNSHRRMYQHHGTSLDSGFFSNLSRSTVAQDTPSEMNASQTEAPPDIQPQETGASTVSTELSIPSSSLWDTVHGPSTIRSTESSLQTISNFQQPPVMTDAAESMDTNGDMNATGLQWVRENGVDGTLTVPDNSWPVDPGCVPIDLNSIDWDAIWEMDPKVH